MINESEVATANILGNWVYQEIGPVVYKAIPVAVGSSNEDQYF